MLIEEARRRDGVKSIFYCYYLDFINVIVK
jgi:hypothetical protein